MSAFQRAFDRLSLPVCTRAIVDLSVSRAVKMVLPDPAPLQILQSRMALAASVANLPDDATDDDVDALADTISELDRQIMDADPAQPTVQAAQLQLAVTLWNEQAPLPDRLRTLIEALAAELALAPVPLFMSLEKAEQ